MGKTYTSENGKKYKVLPWGIASVRENRIVQKYKVCCQMVGSLSWVRYPRAAYYDTPEEAERELDTLADRKGWKLCEN